MTWTFCRRCNHPATACRCLNPGEWHVDGNKYTAIDEDGDKLTAIWYPESRGLELQKNQAPGVLLENDQAVALLWFLYRQITET